MFHRMAILSILGLSVAALSAKAGEKDTTKAVLEKARKALGSYKSQAKHKGLSFTTNATIKAPGNPTFNGSWTGSGIDKYRAEVNVTNNGRTENALMIANGGKVWIQNLAINKVKEIPKKEVRHPFAVFRSVRFAMHPWLLTSKGLKRSHLGELQVNNKPAIGMKIEQKGHNDIELYFDKKTGMILKADVRIIENQNTGQELLMSFHFQKFKKIDGIKHATQIIVHRDGQQVATVEVSNFALHETVEKATFAKP